MVRRDGGKGLERFSIRELVGVVESPNSESEEYADDPEQDLGADETLDTEADRRGVWDRAASRGDVLRGIPLVRRGVAGTRGDMDDFDTGFAGDARGSSVICTCGNILEVASCEITSSRENEIGTVTSLQKYK